MSLHGELIEARNVTPSQREEMHALMQAHYDHVRREVFEADLAEKDWVILLFDEDHRVRGFSTQMLLHLNLNGEPVTALFSGDTIVHRDSWAQNPLSRIWGRFALSLIDQIPPGSLYWFLISKGYKTYRFLPVFFRRFFPHFRDATPAREAALLAGFAAQKFPTSFDREAGVIRAAAKQCCLKPSLGAITQQRLTDPHVAFFADRNPGHWQGDELCCLAPLLRENFTRAAYRVMGLANPSLAELSEHS